ARCRTAAEAKPRGLQAPSAIGAARASPPPEDAAARRRAATKPLAAPRELSSRKGQRDEDGVAGTEGGARPDAAAAAPAVAEPKPPEEARDAGGGEAAPAAPVAPVAQASGARPAREAADGGRRPPSGGAEGGAAGQVLGRVAMRGEVRRGPPRGRAGQTAGLARRRHRRSGRRGPSERAQAGGRQRSPRPSELPPRRLGELTSPRRRGGSTAVAMFGAAGAGAGAPPGPLGLGPGGGLLGVGGGGVLGGFLGLPPGVGALLPPPPAGVAAGAAAAAGGAAAGPAAPGGGGKAAAKPGMGGKGGMGGMGGPMGGMGKPPAAPPPAAGRGRGAGAGAGAPAALGGPVVPGLIPGIPGVGALVGPPAHAGGGGGHAVAGQAAHAVPAAAAPVPVGWQAGMPAAGGALPQFGAAFAQPAVAGVAAAAQQAGPWVYVPMAPQAVTHGLLGLSAGCRVELVMYDAACQPSGTTTMTVTGLYPPDAAGEFVECTVESSSDPLYLPILQGIFAMGSSVVHLCTQGVATCCRTTAWPGRNVVHSDTLRVLGAAGPGGGAADGAGATPPGALPAGGAPPAADAGPVVPGKNAGGAPKGSGGADGEDVDGRTAEEMRKIVKRLKEKLQRKRSMGEALAERAEAALEGRRSRKKQKNRDKDSSDSASFDEAPTAGSGRRVQKLARSDPGALMAAGLKQIREYLAQRGGADNDDELDRMASNVVQYITSVWHGMHPQNEMGVRNVREMRMIGECLDALTRGDLPQLGDMLMQRLKAIEQATKDGHWKIAEHLELIDSTDIGLASSAEVSAAVASYSEGAKLKDALSRDAAPTDIESWSTGGEGCADARIEEGSEESVAEPGSRDRFADDVTAEAKAGNKGKPKGDKGQHRGTPPWRSWNPKGKGGTKGQARGKGKACDCTSDGSWESEITFSSYLEDECNGAAHGAVSDEPSTRIHDFPYLNPTRAASELGSLCGAPVRVVGRRLADLSTSSPASSGALGNFDAKSYDDILSPLTAGNGRRDLLPLPCVDLTIEELSMNGVVFGESEPVDPSFEDDLNGWLKLTVLSLNFQYALGGKHPGLKMAPWKVRHGPASAVQLKALRLLARSVGTFLCQYEGSVANLDWTQELKSSAVSYTGMEVYPAEQLDRERLLLALPSKEACGSVLATEVSEGWIRSVLEHPEWVMKSPAELGEMPKTPRVWAEDDEWGLIAAELVNRGILVPIEADEIVKVKGRRVLGGLFGVRKSGRVKGSGPQRLVMNIIPSNWLQETVQGDMGLLPTTDKWKSIILRSGEVMMSSSEDLKCCFYVYRLPAVWHKYMALSKKVSRSCLGLDGAGEVHVAAAVIPMGWVSATGIIQHIHRRLLREWLEGVPPLPEDRELRRDLPLPPHRERGSVVSQGEARLPVRGELGRSYSDERPQVYIGRTGQRYGFSPSKWANPFKVSKMMPRSEAIANYESHLRDSPDLLACLPELSGCRLLCHCRRGQRCHGDVLVKMWAETVPKATRGDDTLIPEGAGTACWVVWQVYIDNLDVLEVTDEVSAAALKAQGPPEVVQLACERYAQRGVPRSEDKAVCREPVSQVLGELIDGTRGVISPPLEFVYRLLGLTFATLDRNVLTQTWLQVVAGRWVRAMMFRRETMSVFDDLWRAVVRWRGERRLPAPVQRELLLAVGLLPLMRCDLRTPVSGLVTVSDASMRKGAVCRAVRLLPHGVEAAKASRRRQVGRLQDEGVLLSLFDGIGGGRRALDMLGLSVAVYAASETDPEACRVVKYAWPDVVELGDVTKLSAQDIAKIRDRAPHVRWVLLFAGAPCVDLTRLSVDRRGLSGARSGLFYEIKRVKSLVKEVFPVEVEVFDLIENVSSMTAEDRDTMSEHMGLAPVMIDAADISHVRRERLYWCDTDLMTPWQGEVCVKSEVVKVTIPGGPGPLGRWLRPGREWSGAEVPEQRLPTFVRCIPRGRAGDKPKGLHQCSEAELERWRRHDFCYAPYQFRDPHCLRWQGGALEPADSFEREMLMDFPPGHTATARATRFRKLAELEVVRCALLGNSFQCGVVAWIVAHWAHRRGYLDSVPTMAEARAVGGAFDAAEGLVQVAKEGDDSGVVIRDRGLEEAEAQADPSIQIVEELIRRAEVRGSDVRLDTLEVMRPDLWPRRPISVSRWTWKTVLVWKWRWKSHITALEVLSALAGLRWRFRVGHHLGTRFAHLMDSQVGLGVISRGRSSSHLLNAAVKRISALVLAASARPIYGYTETDKNPADDPSREGGMSGDSNAKWQLQFSNDGLSLVIALPVTKAGKRRHCEESVTLHDARIVHFIKVLTQHLPPESSLLQGTVPEFRDVFKALLRLEHPGQLARQQRPRPRVLLFVEGELCPEFLSLDQRLESMGGCMGQRAMGLGGGAGPWWRDSRVASRAAAPREVAAAGCWPAGPGLQRAGSPPASRADGAPAPAASSPWLWAQGLDRHPAEDAQSRLASWAARPWARTSFSASADLYATVPDAPSIAALRRLQPDFVVGRFDPYAVVVVADAAPLLDRDGYDSMIRRGLLGLGGVGSLLGPGWLGTERIGLDRSKRLPRWQRRLYDVVLDTHVNGSAALLQVHTRFLPRGARADEWVRRARGALHAWEGLHPGWRAALSGGACAATDASDATLGALPSYLGACLAGCGGLVLLMFRSLLLPLRLGGALVFTLAATFGVAAVIYQTPLLHGICPELRNFDGICYQAIPIAVCVAVALGIDYDIFLVSRIFEYRLSGLGDCDSIVQGVARTGGIISGAGIIMALAFSGMLYSDRLLHRQIAVILVVSVLLDTFVVRTVLVPASMFVAREWNWWPRRVPRGRSDADTSSSSWGSDSDGLSSSPRRSS
ncbi:unnamed protein product, partial [Prorocentrum cordatum]